jgi:hypothetical protein
MTLTSKNLPKEIPDGQTTAPPDSQVAATPVQFNDDDIVARPLVSPDFTNIEPANPNMSLRLVNRLALGGQRFEEAKIQGFIVCKPEDIKDIPNTWSVKDGCVIYGDVIAMMMPREKYLGAIKHNEQNARKLVHRQAVQGLAHDKLTEALNEVPGSRADKAKIKLYQPEL